MRYSRAWLCALLEQLAACKTLARRKADALPFRSPPRVATNAHKAKDNLMRPTKLKPQQVAVERGTAGGLHRSKEWCSALLQVIAERYHRCATLLVTVTHTATKAMASSTRLALLALAMSASGLVAPGRQRAQIRMGMGNSFGTVLPHQHVGRVARRRRRVVVDGCPPRVPLTEEPVQFELNRRRPGQSRLTTPRNESDTVEILSGVDKESGVTLGTPIAMLVRNKDQKSNDYDTMAKAYRPSHADATYDAKYGVRAVAGGGRSSARETIGRVAGGAVAREVLKLYSGVEVLAYVQAVQDVGCPKTSTATPSR